MRHGSLFSGIGGFDLAAEWMGWENVFHCEWNEFGKRVLSYYWPKAISYHDITKTDFTIHRGRIDILTGGFPCQPYSAAGKRKGKEDDRHLWPEMLRAIREIQPRWVVGENVLGLVNWSGGLVFHEVQADLEAAGYEVWPYVLPACGVNAPHRRDRVWFVAYCEKRGNGKQHNPKKSGQQVQAERYLDRQADKGAASHPCGKRLPPPGGSPKLGRERSSVHNPQDEKTNSYTNGGELQGRQVRQEPPKRGKPHNKQPGGRSKLFRQDWEDFPSQPPVCSRNDGVPGGLDGITFPKWRNESIKAYGNAVVPQVVYQIFKAIEAYNAAKNL